MSLDHETDAPAEASMQASADQPADRGTDTASFGYREVPADEKASMVGDVFRSVASRYDIMNDLMSAGIHRIWKDRFVTALRPRAGEAFLDLAGGTGDIAERILRRTEHRDHDRLPESDTAVTLCDINEAMVVAGRDRMIDRGRLNGIRWTVGDAEQLPFADASFDAVTIAFGIRNVTRIDRALRDIRRVLRPGGRFFCLEFSHVMPALKPFYDTYSFQVLPRLGAMVAGDREAYQYLAESIRRFPPAPDFEAMIVDAGFRRTGHEMLTGGIAAIHRGRRI